MTDVKRVKWHLDPNGRGHVLLLILHPDGSVSERLHQVDSLDQLPGEIAHTIRMDGRLAGELAHHATAEKAKE